MAEALQRPAPRSSGPTVSVVIAARRPGPGLAVCLRALSAQGEQAEEAIVAATFEAPAALRKEFPLLEWVAGDGSALVPQLWALGVRRAQADVVALTTADFAPEERWVAAIRDAYRRWDAAGVGGRIDPPQDGPARAWAAYFQRYSAYLRYQGEQSAGDLAADNAAYPRADLLEHLAQYGDGFWETDYHRWALARGRKLVFCPQVAVRACSSSGLLEFVAQRHRHGRQYGRARAARMGSGHRLLLLAAAPLIPCVLIWRTVVRVWRDGRYQAALLRCLPALCCFVLAWTSGEVRGYLEARGERSPQAG
jgi:hypothetical protein